MRKKSAKQCVAATRKNAQDEIDSLKAQLEELLKERINPALLDAADRADHAVANAREIGSAQMQRMETRVRARPLPSILVSAVIGFIAGRLSK